MVGWTHMINKNIKTNNMTIVRNIVYKQIEKMNKNIKEVIEVDNTLLTMIDINMKNAINKIINDYKLKQHFDWLEIK
jgi:hypothetical protein